MRKRRGWRSRSAIYFAYRYLNNKNLTYFYTEIYVFHSISFWKITRFSILRRNQKRRSLDFALFSKYQIRNKFLNRSPRNTSGRAFHASSFIKRGGGGKNRRTGGSRDMQISVEFSLFPYFRRAVGRMRPRLHVCSGDTPFPAEVFLSGKGEITEVRKECGARKENA